MTTTPTPTISLTDLASKLDLTNRQAHIMMASEGFYPRTFPRHMGPVIGYPVSAVLEVFPSLHECRLCGAPLNLRCCEFGRDRA